MRLLSIILHSMEYDYDDDHEEPNRQELDETLRRFREAVRSGNWQHGIPNAEALEAIVHYCLETIAFEDARIFAKMWTEKAPYSTDAWHKYGIALGSLGRWQEALNAYVQAAKLDPIDIEITVNRGIALEQLGRLEDANKLIEDALDADPNNLDALFTKALILEKRERYDEAMRLFSYLAKQDLFQRDAMFEIAICHEALEQVNEALAIYETLTDVAPFDTNAWFNKGVI